MQAYSDPLERLREALRWFVAVRELLLLHVTSGPELRQPGLQEIVSAQNRHECREAILVCTTPAVDGEADFTARSEEIGESISLVVEAAAKGEPPVQLRAPVGDPAPGFTGFVATLRRAAAALAPAFEGVIVVLAPEGIEQPDVWLSDLRRLVTDRSLQRVRFILLETDPAPGRALSAELAGLGEVVDIRVDPGATRSYLRALVEGMKTAPAGADPHRVAGMAGPREAPPPRAGRSAPAPEAAASELQAAGMSQAFAQPDVMKELRVEALSASLAQQDGHSEEAVQHQIKARDVAERAGLAREATLMQLMLGGYLLQGGGHAQALNVFEEVAQRAKKQGFVELEVQSQMARGGTLLMLGRPFDAAQAYSAGAAVAETSNSKSLAIECYRMVGQILFANGHEREAATAWQRALVVAEGAPKEERVASSAPIAARDLAALYRRNGLGTQADALEQQVTRWESEVPAPAAENGATDNGSGASGSTENSGNDGAHA